MTPDVRSQLDATASTRQMPEHVAPSLVVDLGLEGMAVLEGRGFLSRWTRRDVVVEPFDVRKFCPGIVAHDERGHARPAPKAHVGNRVGIGHEIPVLREPIVEDLEIAVRFELIAPLTAMCR